MSYTKLANSILTSTVWMEEDHTRLVWLAMLAMADKNGEVQASIPGLANIARVPVESCRKAIEIFLSPDPDSRSKVDEGRRIQEINGGWVLINHAEYRKLASDEDRRIKAAERQQRARDRRKRNAIVTPESHQNSQAEAEAEERWRGKEVPALDTILAQCQMAGIPEAFGKWVYDDWMLNDGKRSNGLPCKCWDYVKLRWAREQTEWRAGVHKGNKKPATGSTGAARGGYESGPDKRKRLMANRHPIN